GRGPEARQKGCLVDLGKAEATDDTDRRFDAVVGRCGKEMRFEVVERPELVQRPIAEWVGRRYRITVPRAQHVVSLARFGLRRGASRGPVGPRGHSIRSSVGPSGICGTSRERLSPVTGA